MESEMETGGEGALGVLLDDPESIEVLAIGEVLAAALGLPRADATRRARYCRGVLLSSAQPEVASGLLEALQQRGHSAFTVPARSLLQIPEAIRIREVRLSPAELTATSRAGRAFTIPWEQIGAMSITALEAPTEAKNRQDKMMHAVSDRILRPGLVRVLDEIQDALRKGQELRIECDLLCPDAEALLRMERDCRMVGLPEGQENLHSLERYVRFLEEAIGRSGAYVPSAGLAFIENLKVRSILLTREEERRNQNLWLWQMLVTGRLEEKG